ARGSAALENHPCVGRDVVILDRRCRDSTDVHVVSAALDHAQRPEILEIHVLHVAVEAFLGDEDFPAPAVLERTGETATSGGAPGTSTALTTRGALRASSALTTGGASTTLATRSAPSRTAASRSLEVPGAGL